MKENLISVHKTRALLVVLADEEEQKAKLKEINKIKH